jgi:prepilin-type processing-associated H-X9-DG protein
MVNQQTNNDNMAGGSYWSNATQNGYNIYGSYNYRALSYAKTHSNGTLRTNIAGSSGFGLTMDLVTANATATSRNYGRKFHHLDGWNIAYGDGHATYFQDPNGDEDPPTRGFVETVVVGGEAKGYKGPSGFPNDTAGVEINGSVKPGADEAVFKYFGAK